MEENVKKILIADDAAIFRKHAEGILRNHGFAFLHASDGAEAVKLAVNESPDVILLDVQMPVIDGHQVLTFLRNHDQTAHIPVVVISVMGEREMLLQKGAAAVLSKPINPAALSRQVRDLLSEPRRTAARL